MADERRRVRWWVVLPLILIGGAIVTGLGWWAEHAGAYKAKLSHEAQDARIALDARHADDRAVLARLQELAALPALRGADLDEAAGLVRQLEDRYGDLGLEIVPKATYQVRRVIDGDTIEIVDAGGIRTRVRFQDVDAPEMDEPGGPEAKAALEERLMGHDVVVTPHARDRYGRLIADVEPLP